MRTRHTLDKAQTARFREMFLRGVVLKRIAEELEIPFATAKQMRAKMKDLPARKGKNCHKWINISLRMKEEIHSQARHRASVRGEHFSCYLHNLVSRDLGR
jgi:hypothetical protein